MCLLAAVESASELRSMLRCVAALARGRWAAMGSLYLYTGHNAHPGPAGSAGPSARGRLAAARVSGGEPAGGFGAGGGERGPGGGVVGDNGPRERVLLPEG